MIVIKAAFESDADLLSELAYYSELYWGYDDEYMENFKLYYNVTAEFIKKNPVSVLKEDNRIIGFWGMQHATGLWELEYFYMTVGRIGKGHGRQLWGSLIEECKKNQIEKFEFVTSPQAVKFYEKMGAETIGRVKSVLKQGRMIPKLRYTLNCNINILV